MSDTTGPISTLPGARHAVPPFTMCDEHPDRLAVARIQGETDSFGCEMIDCCAECRDELLAEMRKPHEGVCDWCKNHSRDLRPRRDFEEGMHGRVYDVCRDCIARENERLEAELDDGGDWYD